VILRTNHRLRWPPTFPSAIILQPEAREQAVMVLQAGDNSYEEPEPASQAKSRPRKPLEANLVALAGEMRVGGAQGC
jgi:hypothetical protein